MRVAAQEQRSKPGVTEALAYLLPELFRTDSFELALQLLVWEVKTTYQPASIQVFTVENGKTLTPRVQSMGPATAELQTMLPQLLDETFETTGVHELSDTARLVHARIITSATDDVLITALFPAQTAPDRAEDVATILQLTTPALINAKEREHLQGELLEAKRLVHDTKAERRARSAFISRMSHDLRSPLSAIMGFTQLFDLERISEEQRGYLSQILTASQRLNDLINQVLEYTSVESGRLTVHLQPVMVEKTIKKCAQALSRHSTGKQVKVLVTAKDTTPQHVLADPTRIEQVFLNLLSNAIKFSPPSGTVRVSSTVSRQGQIHIQVADDGPGIPHSHHERIFHPFERAADTAEQQGAGLGLSVARALTEAMDGYITVKSEPGQGSVFTVTLPAS